MLNTLSKRYIVRRVPTRLKFQIASRKRCETDAECGYSDQHQPYRLTPKYHQVAPSTAPLLIFRPLESAIVRRSGRCVSAARPFSMRPDRRAVPWSQRRNGFFTEVPVMSAPGCKRPLGRQLTDWIWRG